MFVLFITVACLIWIVSEIVFEKQELRIAFQLVAISILLASVFFGSSMLTRISVQAEASNSVKNLTATLVAITELKDIDVDVLNARLKTLDEKIVPSYEEIESIKSAIADFVAEYEIEFKDFL
jgi:hypothetical protein